MDKRDKMIKDLKKQLKRTELQLNVYEEYTDQIEFTDADIKKLDRLSIVK